jgi:hypothetical protein
MVIDPIQYLEIFECSLTVKNLVIYREFELLGVHKIAPIFVINRYGVEYNKFNFQSPVRNVCSFKYNWTWGSLGEPNH